MYALILSLFAGFALAEQSPAPRLGHSPGKINWVMAPTEYLCRAQCWSADSRSGRAYFLREVSDYGTDRNHVFREIRRDCGGHNVLLVQRRIIRSHTEQSVDTQASQSQSTSNTVYGDTSAAAQVGASYGYARTNRGRYLMYGSGSAAAQASADSGYSSSSNQSSSFAEQDHDASNADFEYDTATPDDMTCPAWDNSYPVRQVSGKRIGG